MLGAMRYNIANLANFRGRETRAVFWPYAAFVIIVAIIGIAAMMLPVIADVMERMQRFAAEHPDLATVRSGPGRYSISIRGYHPELVPDMSGTMMRMSIASLIVAALLAAAVVRRLHDCGKSGGWGLLPVPFLLFGSLAIPKVFTQNPPDIILFFGIFINNLLYLVSLVTLIVMLAGESSVDVSRPLDRSS